MSDDLQKEAFKEMILPVLGQSVKDVIIFRSKSEDTLSAAQVKPFIMERILGDVQDQVIRIHVDNIETREPPARESPPQEVDWPTAWDMARRRGQ